MSFVSSPTNSYTHCSFAHIAPGAQGSAFWSVGVEMARKEGIMSLMGGLSASMVRELVYSGIRLGTYDFFKDKSVLFYDLPHGHH